MEERDEAFRKEIEAAVARAKNPKGAANMLALLFPKVERVLKTYVPESMDRWESKRARRISEKDFAESYFGLDPQPLIWTHADIEGIVSANEPSALLTDAQRRIEQAQESDRPRLRIILLESLIGIFDQARPLTSDWLKGFVDASPYFITNRDEGPELFGSNNLQRMQWVVHSGAEQLDSQKRYDVFYAVIRVASDLTLLSYFVRTHTPDSYRDNKGDNAKSDFFDARGVELRNLLLHRIRQLASSGELWSQADPGQLLWLWWSSGQENEIKNFTAKAVETSVGLRAMLRIPVSLVRSSGGNFEQVGSYWSSIVDLDDLARRANFLDTDKSALEDRNLARRFLAALERGKKERF